MDDGGKIFGKLDQFTCKFYNKSFCDLFEFLRLPRDLFLDFLSSGFDKNRGYCIEHTLIFSGISFVLDYNEFILFNCDYSTIWTSEFKKISLECSESGLDYLRALAFHEVGDIENYLNNVENYPGVVDQDFKITRVKFVFDFINYERCPDFVEKLTSRVYEIRCGDHHGSSFGFVKAGCSKRPFKYSICGGVKHAIQLGATGSPKSVKICNKLMQYKKNGVIVKPLPDCYKDIDLQSWFQIEFDTRQKEAGHYLFSVRNFKDIFKILFNDYLMRDSHGNPIDFMFELYKWESLQEISHNESYIQRS